MKNSNIIKFNDIKKMKVAVEVNNEDVLFISIPMRIVKGIGHKISSIFGGKK